MFPKLHKFVGNLFSKKPILRFDLVGCTMYFLCATALEIQPDKLVGSGQNLQWSS